jgi:hypothetical protein
LTAPDPADAENGQKKNADTQTNSVISLVCSVLRAFSGRLLCWLNHISGLIVAIATVFVAVFAWWQWSTLDGTDKTLKATLEDSRLEQRAWIGAPRIRIEAALGGGVDFIGSIKNVGHLPTKGLFVDAKIISGTNYNWEDESLALCNSGRVRPEKDLSRFSFVPNDDWKFNFRQVPSWGTSAVYVKDLKNLRDPSIAGCILYGTRFDEIMHQLIFVAVIDIKEDIPSVRSVLTAHAV